MTSPFIYPSVPHVRRHGPRGYADHAGFRPWLRDEFSFRCVYCLQRELWVQSQGTFDVDHFLPVSLHPELGVQYDNVLYSCCSCNLAKRAKKLPDPLTALVRKALRVGADGRIEATT